MWRSLELIPGQSALPSVWRNFLADQFDPFVRLCLQPSVNLAQCFPCPLASSCAYRITPENTDPQDQSTLSFDGVLPSSSSGSQLSTLTHSQLSPTLDFRLQTLDSPRHLAVCQRHHCDALYLTTADLTPLELHWPKLARALCSAFGLDTKIVALPIRNAIQIGSWSADAVPVILTIQTERRHFHFTVCELIARLGKRFILLAPTATHQTAATQELLDHADAAFFPLDANLVLTDHGTVHSKITPGDLFAKFTPQPKELDRTVAERAFALVSQFDEKTLTVFRLYCIEELSAQEIARKLHRSKAAIVRHLIKIRAKTGADPRDLRRLSSQFEKIRKEECHAKMAQKG